jgi:hypothetical protein
MCENQISEYTSSDTAIAAVLSALALVRSAMYTVVRTHGAMACSHCIYSSTQLTSCSASVTCVRYIEHYQDCSRLCVLCELCQQTHRGTVTISTTLVLVNILHIKLVHVMHMKKYVYIITLTPLILVTASNLCFTGRSRTGVEPSLGSAISLKTLCVSAWRSTATIALVMLGNLTSTLSIRPLR